jgi:dihydroorotate dehydrogenase (NAD+) catalytic subunit
VTHARDKRFKRLATGMDLPRYDIEKTYRWNYEHVPLPVELEVPGVPGDWRFLGLPVNSPIGIPTGPLLNGKWCLYYASLGFDVLTYKTVHSVARECYPLPNLLPVKCGSLKGDEACVPSSTTMLGSWAVSFGMPSAAPDVWRRDIEWTRKQLPAGKLLNVSVVGTYQTGWTIDDLAEDYAKCARWAVESGAIVSRQTCRVPMFQPVTDSFIRIRRMRMPLSDAFVTRSATSPIQ